MHKYSLKATHKHKNLRLSQFLAEQLKGQFSNRQIKNFVERGLLTVNGKTERFTSSKINTDDVIVLYIEEKKPVVEPILVDILYQDDWYTVINKPPGVECNQEKLKEWLPDNLSSYYLVHRLDRETSGVMVLAATEKSKDYFYTQFKQKKVYKEYLALCDSSIKISEGVIKERLVKHYAKGLPYIRITKSSDHGLSAHTEWKIEEEVSPRSKLIRCIPLTGRTHQIRVHLSSMDMPIYGDKRYSKRRLIVPFFPARCMLHAALLSFIHPQTHKKVSYQLPLPSDFLEAIDKLRSL